MLLAYFRRDVKQLYDLLDPLCSELGRAATLAAVMRCDGFAL
jgi:hypothetical protein